MKSIRRFMEMIFFLLFLFSTAMVLLYSSSPDPNDLSKCLTTQMNNVELCRDSANYVNLDDITPYLKDAVLISEDAGFYHHKGFDFYEMRLSFLTNLKKGRFARGGSTLTQQLVKNVFLTPEKSILRKLREALLTYQVEGLFSKDQIFEFYLNVVEFGPEVFGIKSAAWYYFAKPPSKLSLLESVYLAHLLPNPKKIVRSFNTGTLNPRSQKIIALNLKRLKIFKRITPQIYTQSVDKIGLFPWTGVEPSHEPELQTPEPYQPPTNEDLISGNEHVDEELKADSYGFEE